MGGHKLEVTSGPKARSEDGSRPRRCDWVYCLNLHEPCSTLCLGRPYDGCRVEMLGTTVLEKPAGRWSRGVEIVESVPDGGLGFVLYLGA